ncbi:MAG: helix-turn-helix domain-containing protein [Nitrososphaerota archaeon]
MPYFWRFKKFPESAADPKQLRILTFLRSNGPHTSSEIARTLGYPVKFTRKTLQTLRRMGAVEVYLKPSRSLEDYGE